MDEKNKPDIKIVSLNKFKEEKKSDSQVKEDDSLFNTPQDLYDFIESSLYEGLNLDEIDTFCFCYTTKDENGLGKMSGHAFKTVSLSYSDASFRLLHTIKRAGDALEEAIYE